MTHEKEIYSRVRMRSLALAIAVSMLVTVAFDNFEIYGIGIILGVLCGIISLNMVVKMADSFQLDKTGGKARLNYFLRISMIGLVFGIAVYLGVSVFALLGGYLITRIAVYIESIKIKK